MYIGSTGSRGLHHLVYEVVDNSIDEAMAGYCDNIRVVINSDNSITVKDNGRGIPVKEHPQQKKSALEVVMTILHAGGKFGGAGYKVAGGLHGVGLSVVNALSAWLEVSVSREGENFSSAIERDSRYSPAEKGKSSKAGTVITFYPDPEIFNEINFDFQNSYSKVAGISLLNKGIKIILQDRRHEEIKEEVFKYDGGISSFVSFLNKNKKYTRKNRYIWKRSK